MKLVCFILTVLMLEISATTYSQTTKLNVRLENVTVKDVFKTIEAQSEFRFFYSDDLSFINKKITLNMENMSVESILNKVLDQSELTYRIFENNLIVVTPEGSIKQGITITGTITDDTGEPMPGANITIKGTATGTVTDIGGKFSINVPNSDAVLQFSFIGYATQEVTVGDRRIFEISLKEDTREIEEVVVVGYGVQKKVNLTGSVATINSSQITARPVTNVSSSLAGLASGVYVRQTSARPGSDGAKIRIRGTGTIDTSDADNKNNALVIIDGIEGVMDAINPEDIENISILKDAASASIYGARAANGVILITTKKGTKSKPKVSISANWSIAQPTNIPEFISDYTRYMRLMNESGYNIGRTASIFSDNTINTWEAAAKDPNGLTEHGYPNYLVYPNTDWGDVLFENNIIQNYNISVNGGGENSRYNLSAGYMDNPGVIDNTGMKKYQLRINLESTIAKFLTLGTNTFMSTQFDDKGVTDGTVFNYLRQKVPGLYPYLYNGYWAASSAPEEATTSLTLFERINADTGKDQTSRLNTTVYANINILKGLTFETKVNYQLRFREISTHPVTYGRWNFATDLIHYEPTVPAEMTTYYKTEKNYQLTFDNVLRYSFDIGKHSFNILAGHNEYYYNTYNYDATKKGLIDSEIYTLTAANETENKATGSESDRGMRSFFGRINYDYASKYLFEFNIRRDGSSNFGKDNRWGTFPGASAAWRISEETFFDPLRSTVQNLKLRASWGKLGNDVAGDYVFQTNYGASRYVFGNKSIVGLATTKMGNPGLRWESTEVKEIGLEGGLLGNRATFEVVYYDKYTDGILTSPPIPLTAGRVTGPTQNTASVLNRGIELNLGWSDRIGEISYSVRGNFSYNFNQVKEYKGKFADGWQTNASGQEVWATNLGDVSSSSGNGYILEGYQIYENYLRKPYAGDGTYTNTDGSVNINGGPKDGMIRTEEDMNWVKDMRAAGKKFSPTDAVGKAQLYYGDLIFADLNGDGTYGDSYDREFTGKSSMPKYTYGFSFNVEWKGIDFSMLWAGNAGMYYYYMETGYNNSVTMMSNAIATRIANNHYYYNENDPNDPNNNINGYYSRLRFETNTINATATTKWLYNASYLKLKNLQLGYTLPSALTKKINISNVRVYFTGENLLTITPYPFLDPEIGAGIGYPTMRQFALGINVNF